MTIGLQADCYVSNNVGLGVGVDYYIRESKFDVKLSDYSHKYRGIDNWGADPVPREYEFTVKSNVPDIVEQNAMSYIDFPISVFYRIPLNDKIDLDTRLGVKMDLLLKSSYQLRESDLYTRLYFEEWDLELFKIPAHGLYDSRTDWHPSGEINLAKVFSLFSEVGLDFSLALLKIRISGYFSYGLNSMVSKTQSSLIYWPEKYNNILSLPLSVNLMQYGIKLDIGINKSRKKGKKYGWKKTKCGGILY